MSETGENSGWKNMLVCEQTEEVLSHSEQSFRLIVESILSSAKELTNPELAEIVDIQAVQSLMDDFHKLVHVTTALVDLKGNVLVGVGWQDICTKFHRIHPETCKYCMESDIKLSSGVSPGKFKLYKCKNNMWDVATPVMVGGQHVGNVFSGQFFFEDEPLDYEFFRSQARKYGFNEEKYLAALEKVPRLSQEAVDMSMAFFTRLAHMISELSYSKLKLAKSLVERDALVEALRESEEKYRNIVETANEGIWIIDNEDRTNYVNKKMAKMLGYGQEEMIGRSGWEFTDKKDQAVIKLILEMRQRGSDESREFKFIRKDGSSLWTLVNIKFFFDRDGKFTGSMGMLTDITKRKKVEEALRSSNIYNRSLIEANPDPLITIGHDGKVTDMNSASEQITGYFRNELIGTVFSDYFTEPEKADAGYRQVFVNGEVRDYPLEVQHKDGHITPVLYNASVYRDEDGKVLGILAAARDITERKKAEDTVRKAHDNLEKLVKERTAELEMSYNLLKESEKRLAEAQKMAHIGNWEWDIAADEAYWSEEMYRIFGRDPQGSAPPFNEYLNYIHPDDRDYYCNALKKAVKGKLFGIDYRIILANGEERIVHLKSEFITNDENIPIKIKGTVQDITESRKAEERIRILASAVESSSDSIITRSLDDIIISWNKGAERIHGYSAEEVMGKPVSILEPDSLKGEIKRFSEMIKKGKTIENCETSRLRKDGTIITVSITLSPVFNASGELVAISAISRDITERKREEEEVRESEARMRRFYESGMFGVFYHSIDGSIADANNKFLEIVGYTREDLQAGKINWKRMTPPEYCLLDKNCIAELKTNGVNAPYEKEFIRKDGSRVPIILGAAIFYQAHNEGIAFVLDITEQKQREQKIRRYYNVLEGINRIFGSVIRAETEEELANVCLSVALELTGSQTGFVGEVGAGSMLRGVAASSTEWTQRLIYDNARDYHSLGDFILHGVSGLIIDSEKAFFTNDPQSYLSSIKMPYGHPPLESFLSVPLLSGGKSIGLMAVANRDGGYNYEQQEDLEALAPAVVQALQRKRAERALVEMDKIRIKEIHHRIKNNLQVIFSLLDLQAEKFQDKEILEAFRESQSRLLSMSLIHEELYKGEGTDTLDFSTYLRKLAKNLFQTYSLSSENIRLYMDLEENAFFNMDTAVPLGIIVNELVSNSLKHAFPEKEGEIRIQLCREENNKEIDRFKEIDRSLFSLTISDNGKGISENIELRSLESLGLKLVNLLVDQIDGKIELKRNQGTEFKIIFNVLEK